MRDHDLHPEPPRPWVTYSVVIASVLLAFAFVGFIKWA